jgi:hypothetical protein
VTLAGFKPATIRNLYLLSEIKELKGLSYESTDVGKAIEEYQCAILMALENFDEVRATLPLGRLWDNNLEVNQLLKINALTDAIKRHPNNITLYPELEEFEKKVNEHNNNT